MSFRKNEKQQLSFNDSYMRQSARAKRHLENSWAEGFAKEIFPRINEERFRVLYSEQQFSRPNTPVNVIIGALVLKEMNQLTDDELLESVLFDVRYQYALRTTSCEEQPFSDRTVSRFRARLLEYEQKTGVDLLKEEMLALADAFVQHLGMDTRKKRMDSLMVAMNCRRMSQLEMFYTCVAKLVKYLAKHGIKPAEGFEKYLDEDNRTDTIYRAKPDEIQERLLAVVEDGFRLLGLLPEACHENEACKILKRCLEEQTREIDGKHEVKGWKELKPTSLQSPFDPDATYRFKSGQHHRGYTGNVVETVEGENEATRAMITDFDYQRNTYDDSQFCKDTLKKMGIQEEAVQLVADGGYISVKNVETAASQNIELISGSMVGGTPKLLFAEFEVDAETNTIAKCPAGNVPQTSRFYEKGIQHEHNRCHRITFETSVCKNCPHKGVCRVEFRKTKAVVTVREATLRRAAYAKKMATDEYHKLIRFRAGVEGIPSVLRRKYRVDKIPDRGYLRTKLWFTVKIGAINARRLVVAYKKRASLADLLKNILQIFSMTLFLRLRAKKLAVLTP